MLLNCGYFNINCEYICEIVNVKEYFSFYKIINRILNYFFTSYKLALIFQIME